MFSGHEPPSGRFNAGEKLWFWGGASMLGIIVSLSGYVLDFPNFDQTRQTMQTFNVIHMIAGLLAVCVLSGHIFLGTIGMDGAWEAMRYGYVDETWAKEHHEYWYNEVKSGSTHANTMPPAAAPRSA